MIPSKHPKSLPRWAENWLCRVLPGPISSRRLMPGHGPSRVWRLAVAASSSKAYFLKVASADGPFRRELNFYRLIAPQLAPWVPICLAFCDRGVERALLLEDLGGTPFLAVDLSDADRLDLHRQAGEFLKKLHQSTWTGHVDPMPLHRGLRRRLASGFRVSRDLLDPEQKDLVEYWLEALQHPLTASRRVPCHRDFCPRNWLVINGEAGLALRVFDFEHFRMDAAPADLAKMWHEVWDELGAAKLAFASSYGEVLESSTPLFRLIHVLGTLTWARNHGDSDFLRRGMDGLKRL